MKQRKQVLCPVRKAMEELGVQMQYAPSSICFGCGPANEKGLQIKSVRIEKMSHSVDYNIQTNVRRTLLSQIHTNVTRPRLRFPIRLRRIETETCPTFPLSHDPKVSSSPEVVTNAE